MTLLSIDQASDSTKTKSFYATKQNILELIPNSKIGVQRLRHNDLDQICDLFIEVFRSGKDVDREAVKSCLKQTYLSSPLDQVRPASLVDKDVTGRVVGFIGIVSLSAKFGKRELKGGICGCYMTIEGERAKSGLRLARAIKNHDIDFLFTDTANRTSTNLLSSMQFDILGLQSLEWVKILKPMQTAAFLIGRWQKTIGRFIQPLAWILDFAAARCAFASIPFASSAIVDREVGADQFLAGASALVQRFHLRPDWNETEFYWLIKQAQLKTKNGPLQIREVSNAKGQIHGYYLVYLESGGVAHALQIIANKHCEGLVLDSLMRHASAKGAVAVRGAAGPHIIDGLRTQRGILYHQVSSNVCYSRHTDLRAAFHQPDMLIGGLFGETWCRLTTETFS